MPTVLHTWTHPTTAGLTLITAAITAINALQIPQNDKDRLNDTLLDIGIDLLLREIPPTDGTHPPVSPYVITVDQTPGGMISDPGTAVLRQIGSKITATGNLPREIAQQIQVRANPTTRYRILTQDGAAPQQVRVQVFV